MSDLAKIEEGKSLLPEIVKKELELERQTAAARAEAKKTVEEARRQGEENLRTVETALPTGEENKEKALAANLRFGAGVPSLLAAAEGSIATSRQRTWYARADVRAPLGSGEAGVRYGRTFTSVAGIDAPLRGDRSAVILQALWQRQGVDRQAGLSLENRGSSSGYLLAGGRLTGGEGWQAAVLLQRLVHADVRGAQLVAPWSVLLSASVRKP
jgi:hypothetical protein